MKTNMGGINGGVTCGEGNREERTTTGGKSTGAVDESSESVVALSTTVFKSFTKHDDYISVLFKKVRQKIIMV